MLQRCCSISCLQGLATLHQPFVMNSCMGYQTILRDHGQRYWLDCK